MFGRTALTLPLLLAAAAAGAQPPVPPPPPVIKELGPHFSCVVERSSPIGTVEAIQFLSPDGVRDTPAYSWATLRAPEGIALTAAWGDSGPQDGDFVQIDYLRVDPDRRYRIQIRRSGENDAGHLLLESDLGRPRDGMVYTFTHWGFITAALSATPDPRLVVVGAQGNVVRSDPIDPTAFARAAALTASLRPELDAMVADYRHLCPFVDGGLNLPADQVAN